MGWFEKFGRRKRADRSAQDTEAESPASHSVAPKEPASQQAEPEDPLAGYLNWAGGQGFGAIAPGSTSSEMFTRQDAQPGTETAPDPVVSALQELNQIQGDDRPEAVDRRIALAAWLEAHQDHPLVTANLGAIQSTRGTALWDRAARRSGQESLADLEAAIAAYRAALRILTEARDPRGHAKTQANLGNAMKDRAVRRSGQEGLADLEAAIAAHRAALRILTEERDPQNHALTQMNLGVALRTRVERRSGQEGLADLEAAIAAYRAALRIRTEEDDPRGHATTQSNLGTALWDRAERRSGQEGLADLEAAIAAHRAALRILTEERDPQGHASTQMNLGTALQTRAERRSGQEGLADLEAAIAAYGAALRIRTEEDDPRGHAVTQMGLGNAMKDRAARRSGQEGLADLEAAITAYRAALRILTEESDPRGHARTQNNLGTALLRRGERRSGQEGLADLAAAIAAYGAALRILTAEGDPQDHAGTQLNLSGALLFRSGLPGWPGAVQDLHAARECLEAVLSIWTAETDGLNWLQAKMRLVTVLSRLGEGALAEVHLGEALSWVRRSVITSEDMVLRQALLGEVAGWSDRLARVQAKRGEIAAALQTVGRGRQIGATVDLLLARLADDPKLEGVRAARQALFAAQGAFNQAKTDEARQAASETVRDASAALTAALEASDLAPLLEPPGAEEILAALSEGGVLAVVLLRDQNAGVLLVPQAGGLEAARLVDLPALTGGELWALLGELPQPGEDGTVAPLDPALEDTWFALYPLLAGPNKEAWQRRSGDVAAWHAEVAARHDALCTRLWQTVMGPIDAALREMGLPDDGTTELVMMAPGRLALLPLAAARADPDDPPFLAAWTVSASASPHALVAAAKMRAKLAERADPPRLLSLCDPLGDLQRARTDTAPAQPFFAADRQTALGGPHVTRSKVTEALGGVSHICFFGHGLWDPNDPSRSGLVVFPEPEAASDTHTLLTVADLQSAWVDLEASRVWFLAACETAPGFQGLPDEFLSLAAGLNSLTPAVLSSLHPVDIAPTALVIQGTLTLHLDPATGAERMSLARALREVQLALWQGGWNGLVYLIETHAQPPLEVTRDREKGPEGKSLDPFAPELRVAAFDAARSRPEDAPTAPHPPSRTLALHSVKPEHNDRFKNPYYWAGFTLVGA